MVPPTSPLRDWDAKLPLAMPWNGSSQSWAVYFVVEARKRDRTELVEGFAVVEEAEDAGGEVDASGEVDEEDESLRELVEP